MDKNKGIGYNLDMRENRIWQFCTLYMIRQEIYTLSNRLAFSFKKMPLCHDTFSNYSNISVFLYIYVNDIYTSHMHICILAVIHHSKIHHTTLILLHVLTCAWQLWKILVMLIDRNVLNSWLPPSQWCYPLTPFLLNWTY